MRRSALFLPIALLLACGEKDTVDSADVDADGDGYSALEDCDDNDASAFPGNPESCDGVDNDCNGVVDDGVQGTFYADSDGDGYGDATLPTEACEASSGTVEDDTDCNDADAAINPGASEDDCTDPVDYNCDGTVAYEDADGDDWAECEDCDDNNSTINPDADEVCDNVDNNCDGTRDEGTAIDADTFYADTDGDGYGDASNTTTACFDAPSGYTDDDTDCNDADADIYPNAPEVCDGEDSDCSGTVGELLVPTDYATIEEALDSGETLICLEAGTYNVNLDLSGTSDLHLAGVGSDQVTLDGGGADRVIMADETTTNLSLSGLTVSNGYVYQEFGAGIWLDGVAGAVVLDDIVATANVGEDFSFGHAIALGYMDEATLTDIEVHGNTANAGAPSYGALGVVNVGTLTLDGVDVYDNTSNGTTWSGGVNLFINDTVSINDLNVYDNTYTGDGTYYYAPLITYSNTSLDATNVSVTGNSAVTDFAVSGGWFLYQDQDATIQNVESRGNVVTGSGTGSGSEIWSGGLAAYYNTSITATNVLVAGNVVKADLSAFSGGIINMGPETATWTNVTVHGNSAEAADVYSGGFSCYNLSEITLVNVTNSSNTVTATGISGAGFDGLEDLDPGSDCSWAVSYTNGYGNDNADWGVTLTDPTGSDGNISVDPGFSDVSSTDSADWDLTLGSSSALIDAGDTAIQDADGSTSDIGAYGGPDGDSW